MKSMTEEIHKQLHYDRKGNGYNAEDTLIEPYAGNVPIDNSHFLCVVCKDVRPVTLPGGVIASAAVGGWTCDHHKNHSK